VIAYLLLWIVLQSRDLDIMVAGSVYTGDPGERVFGGCGQRYRCLLQKRSMDNTPDFPQHPFF
jgi:hypothetical protein